MATTVTILFTIPVLVLCSNDGNISLLKEDIATALRCANVNDNAYSKEANGKRQRRSSDSIYDNSFPRIDANAGQEMNQYGHERRNTRNNKMFTLKRPNNDSDIGSGCGLKNFVNAKHPTVYSKLTNGHLFNLRKKVTRVKRNVPIISKDDNDQCLSQCVFANLQVVNSKGIPREAELWNKVKMSVASQHLQLLLKDQIRACFQELQNESEDNGCSYSNKLERCLMLRLSDRKTNGTNNTSDIKTETSPKSSI